MIAVRRPGARPKPRPSTVASCRQPRIHPNQTAQLPCANTDLHYFRALLSGRLAVSAQLLVDHRVPTHRSNVSGASWRIVEVVIRPVGGGSPLEVPVISVVLTSERELVLCGTIGILMRKGHIVGRLCAAVTRRRDARHAGAVGTDVKAARAFQRVRAETF